MKRKMKLSIRHRICLSFMLFVALFIINGTVVMTTVLKTRKMALHIATAIDPSLKQLDEFHDMIIRSKMYTTNWVFIGRRKEDKDSLIDIHNNQYTGIKANLKSLSKQWTSHENLDSLQTLFAKFEKVLLKQKEVMQLLPQPGDSRQTFKKQEAEMILSNDVIPAIDAITGTLRFVIVKEQSIKASEENILEHSFKNLWIVILLSVVSIILLAVILSRYLTTSILKPIEQIRSIIEDLSSGISRKIVYSHKQNEIGEMVSAVNNLSDRLKYTASFARNIGERNYEMPFEPLSEEDVLGKSLVVMRNSLRAMDENLNQAQHIAKLGSWEWDFTLDKISWSDELYHIFDKDKAGFVPSFETVINYIHADDRDAVVLQFDRCLKNHQPFSLDCRLVTTGGTVKNVHAQINVFINDNNELCKLFGIMQDISERIEKEQELQRTTERFQNLSKATSDSIWDWNLITDEVWWNDNFYKVFDYNPDGKVPAVGEWIMKLHPEDREKMLCKLKEIKESNIHSWEDEFRYTKKDGTIGVAFNRAYVLRDQKRNPIRVIGAILDVTQRKNAEQRIADSEERYRKIVETSQEGIWLLDENNYTVFVNKKMAEMLEYTPGEMIGRQNYDFKDETEKRNAVEQIERRRKGISEKHETYYITKSGKRLWGHVSTNPIFDDEGNYKGALAMVTDITQRKQHEQLLKEHEANLEKKNKELEQKNVELEQFAYIASHDLQEPLRTISSFTDQLQKQYQDKFDAIGQKYLYFIQQGTERMKALITDLLDYSRIGRKKELKTVDCNEIVNIVIDDLTTAIHESKAEIETERLPVINGYTTEVKQLFQNLIANAIKFRKKEEPAKIHICSQQIDGGWEFCVEDNGIGIDEQFSDRIFVIFQRLHTRNEYEGTGIGLSHCKKIVELHGGKIWVKSKPGQGSSFHFTILENSN